MKSFAVRYIGMFVMGLCSVLASADGVYAQEAITLESPLLRQVFQRDAQEQAKVRIVGTVPAPTERVEVRIELTEAATRGQDLDWTTIAQSADIKDKKFSASVKLATGGWYVLHVRARRGDAVFAETKVDKIGVGDIYVTAGQSNSTNYGKPRQTAKDDRVVYFNGPAYVPAADPIPSSPGRSLGGGGTPWPILGDMLVRTIQAPVCFRTATENWLRVRDWLPTSHTGNVQRLVKRVKQVGPDGIRAVLWHQGEADSGRADGTGKKRYARELATVIETARKELGYRVDWFVAAASYCPPRAKDAQVNEWQEFIDATVAAQKSLWDKGIAYRGPDTNDLVGPHRHDRIHFSQIGLQVHAERWYAVLSERYKLANPVSLRPKETRPKVAP